MNDNNKSLASYNVPLDIGPSSDAMRANIEKVDIDRRKAVRGALFGLLAINTTGLFSTKLLDATRPFDLKDEMNGCRTHVAKQQASSLDSQWLQTPDGFQLQIKREDVRDCFVAKIEDRKGELVTHSRLVFGVKAALVLANLVTCLDLWDGRRLAREKKQFKNDVLNQALEREAEKEAVKRFNGKIEGYVARASRLSIEP